LIWCGAGSVRHNEQGEEETDKSETI